MKSTFILGASLLALAACEDAPLGPVDVRPTQGLSEQGLPPAAPFDARAFAWSVGAGPGTLTGVVRYRPSGLPYSCVGEDVLLIPDVPWSRRRMIILYGAANAAAVPVSIVRARTPSAPGGDYARFVRRTSCDADGHFTFRDLPEGGWFVVTVARPLEPSGDPIAITRRVDLRGGARSITLG